MKNPRAAAHFFLFRTIIFIRYFTSDIQYNARRSRPKKRIAFFVKQKIPGFSEAQKNALCWI